MSVEIFSPVSPGKLQTALENKLRGILDTMPNGVQVLNPLHNKKNEITDFVYLFANKAAEVFVGKDITGKRLKVQFHGVIKDHLFEKLVAVVNTGNPEDFIHQYTHEGVTKWVHYTISKFGDGVMIMQEDVTEQKKAEQRVKEKIESLNRSYSTLNTINEACYELDENGTVVFVNRQVLEWWNLKEEDVIGENIWSIFPESVSTHCYDAIQINALNKKQYSQFEYISAVLNKWINLSATPTETGCIVVFCDIDERKEAEQEILRLKDEIARKATDKYFGLFNSIDEGFCIMELLYDAKGNIVDLIFREVNPSFERQTGLSNVIGQKVSELLPNFEQYWIDIYQDVAPTGIPARAENYVKDVNR